MSEKLFLHYFETHQLPTKLLEALVNWKNAKVGDSVVVGSVVENQGVEIEQIPISLAKKVMYLVLIATERRVFVKKIQVQREMKPVLWGHYDDGDMSLRKKHREHGQQDLSQEVIEPNLNLKTVVGNDFRMLLGYSFHPQGVCQQQSGL